VLALNTNVVSILKTAMSRRKPFRKIHPGKSTHSGPKTGQLDRHPGDQGGGPGGSFWIYGHHPVTAALRNPKRKIRRLLASPLSETEFLGPLNLPTSLVRERIEPAALANLLPAGAVHQGLAALVDPLPMVDLPELLEDIPEGPAHLLVLDQVTDPHNVGAILRSASAFGAVGLILTERHAAPESGALAKAASGALDHLPMVRVVNLARAIEGIKQAGFWCLGLAGEADKTLAEANPSGRIALVLGAEGTGMRRLTREHCDQLLRLPTGGAIDQLNVSNAAAVALYELVRNRTAR
jgi:23S rRNA (guanosine2251-2'-O)-methyltransferase